MGLPWDDPNSNPLQDMLDYAKLEKKQAFISPIPVGWTEEQFKQLYFGEWLVPDTRGDKNADS